MPSSNKKPSRDQKAYQTYSKWYDKVSKSNKMSSAKLTFAEYKMQSEMYKSFAKETLKTDANDIEANRALKNISRFVAYEQTELSKAQINAIKEGFKDLKIDVKTKEIKLKGIDYVKSKLPSDLTIYDVYDLGSA